MPLSWSLFGKGADSVCCSRMRGFGVHDAGKQVVHKQNTRRIRLNDMSNGIDEPLDEIVSLQQIPPEILTVIFSMLESPKDIIAVRLTCVYFDAIIRESDHIWGSMTHRLFPFATFQTSCTLFGLKPDEATWKDVFRERWKQIRQLEKEVDALPDFKDPEEVCKLSPFELSDCARPPGSRSYTGRFESSPPAQQSNRRGLSMVHFLLSTPSLHESAQVLFAKAVKQYPNQLAFWFSYATYLQHTEDTDRAEEVSAVFALFFLTHFRFPFLG